MERKKRRHRAVDHPGTDVAVLDGENGNGRRTVPSFKLAVFEGPLDLLLYLIRRDEIDITDIPIARITAEYLGMMRLIEALDLEVAGEYLVMAATLMRIKSAMLLPRDSENEEDEDPREELILALLEYRKFKEGSRILQQHEETERQVYARCDFADGPLPVKSRFVMDQTFFDLLSAFQDILQRDEADTDTGHDVSVPEHTVEERIAELSALFEETESFEFAALFSGSAARWMIIVTFLAILELVRLRRIIICQSRTFGKITLERRSRDA